MRGKHVWVKWQCMVYVESIKVAEEIIEDFISLSENSWEVDKPKSATSRQVWQSCDSYCALIHISSHISIHEKSNVDSLSIILWFFTHTWTVKSHYQAVSNLFHTCVFSVLYVCGAQTSFRGGFELFSESIISNVAKIFPNTAMSQNNCFGCWHAPRLWQDEWKVYDHFKAKLQIKDFKGDVDKYISLLW